MRIKTLGLAAAAVVSLAAATLATPAPAQAQSPVFINVLTGGTAGVYYPLGTALSTIYNQTIPNAKATVQSTKGSVENLNLLAARRGEIAFALGDSVASAYQGDAEVGFPKPLKMLRAIGATYGNYVQIVASADSGVKTLADLKGKRISVGAPKSGTELNARAIFKAAGMTYKDFSKVEYLPFGESVELIKNRQLDATLQSAGLGVASLRDLASAIKIVVVPIPADVVAKVGDPAYQPAVIPAKTYEGQANDVPAAVISNILVTHDKVSDDLAYQMTKSLFTNLDKMVAAHKAASAISLKSATTVPIPMHPGAAKYYKEAGVLK
ncbi:MAG: TAXI family TRAP transporter solute-binding subunit [Lautropia sp.]